MNFKKRVNGSWTNTSHCIMGTSTDTITTLPAVLYPNDTTATVGLKGQTVQNGTPTPDNPIIPEGTGERTGNLFDAATAYGNLYNNGVVSGTTAYVCQVTNYFTNEQIGKQITITIKADKVTATRIYIVANVSGTSRNSNSIYENNTGILQITVTPQSTSDYWKMSYGSNASNECIISNIMLNSGSTALPYEPYGYKIPISSANTTTPVYLGEVETTRRVRKWVLKGDEDGWFYSSGFVYNQNITPDYLRSTAQTVLCSHFKAIPNVTAGGNVGDGECALYSISGVQRLYFRDSNYTTSAADFKAYLARQYANGTPVTVWYVLAEPTTGIVNEPLRKIGDYADTLSGITIPTITGKDSFDVLTTLKPSEVDLTYHGWHDAEVKEWDGSEWQ